MEHVSGVVSGILTVALLGMAAVLVSRRRKHLRLVCRVIDHKDQRLLSFFDQLIERGELALVVTHIFELSIIAGAKGLPAEGHVVHSLQSLPDRFGSGFVRTGAVHIAT
ncbi:MAG: hypothetical protein EXS05_24495, partial [Planctomycetaceae bacterium]|nr:hypothetical protein [Planctomycetaceae bacterium]